MKKQFFIIVDTETTMPTGGKPAHVADFAAVICDRKGNIVKQMAVLTPFFQHEKLFYNRDSGFFGVQNLILRTNKYLDMVKKGERRLANIQAINGWLLQAKKMYNPTLTAYNLPFDKNACEKSGIHLRFKKEFCLWQEATRIFAGRVSYINHVLEHKAISAKLNIQTNADTMSKFLSVKKLGDEPHTALEDIINHEILIFKEIMRAKKGIKRQPYNWRNHALIDHVQAVAKKRTKK